MHGCFPSSSSRNPSRTLTSDRYTPAAPLCYPGTEQQVPFGAKSSSSRVQQPEFSSSFPYSGGAFRSRSVVPSSYGNHINEPMTSAAYPPRNRFNTLQRFRQHRSVDGMELLGECEKSDWPLLPPLNISTTNPVSTGLRLSGAPLSNPTTSNAHFWKQPLSAMPVREALYTPGDDSQLMQEFEFLKRDYESAVLKLNSTMNSIKTFWSPELKRERQLRKEESAKLASLQSQFSHHGMQMGGPSPNDYRVVELEGELENCRYELLKKEETVRRLMERGAGASRLDEGTGCRLAELETRCNQLESLVTIRDQQLRAMEQQITQMPFLQRDSSKDRRISELEDEVSKLRSRSVDAPRDFTDKSVTSHELHTLRMKMERSEMELAQKCSELASVQSRMQAASEENADLRRHLGVLRDSTTAKEQHVGLLQSDIEALRAKLENKNGHIEQKEKLCERLEAELTLVKGQFADLREVNKGSEQRMSQLVAKLDAIEAMLREKETELEKTKQKLLSQPDVQMERQLQLQIEEANREKARLQLLIDDLRRNAEKEKSEQLETFQDQHRQLSSTIESLQKELADRQILLESQNEKIGDLDRELCSVERQRKDQFPQQSQDDQLAEARKEIESLLRMVQALEKEKSSLISQCKQLQSSLDDVHKEGKLLPGSHRSDPFKSTANGTLKNRVEELEEALRESVSITAERELHVAQQKQINQQLSMQLTESRHEIYDLRKRVKELSGGDRDEMMRAFEAERRKHIDQLLQLKHEALVAAIAEKDAHIALLEQSRERPRDEIDTLRAHKEKLMVKLKEENERRAQLLNASSLCVAPGGHIQPGSSESLPGGAALIAPLAPLAPIVPISIDQEDDAEGIWA